MLVVFFFRSEIRADKETRERSKCILSHGKPIVTELAVPFGRGRRFSPISNRRRGVFGALCALYYHDDDDDYAKRNRAGSVELYPPTRLLAAHIIHSQTIYYDQT